MGCSDGKSLCQLSKGRYVMKKQILRLILLPTLFLTILGVAGLVSTKTAPTAHADGEQCTTAHVEVVKRNGDSDDNTVARYIMNKHFCYDGTDVTSSDQADVRGYVVSDLSLVYEFKGNVSTQNGSSTNGGSTAMGSFVLKANVSLPGGFSASDLGLWQPSVTIQPHGDGGFDYSPSSGYTGDPSTIHDIVYAYYV